jgi:hypothetical protein
MIGSRQLQLCEIWRSGLGQSRRRPTTPEPQELLDDWPDIPTISRKFGRICGSPPIFLGSDIDLYVYAALHVSVAPQEHPVRSAAAAERPGDVSSCGLTRPDPSADTVGVEAIAEQAMDGAQAVWHHGHAGLRLGTARCGP